MPGRQGDGRGLAFGLLSDGGQLLGEAVQSSRAAGFDPQPALLQIKAKHRIVAGDPKRGHAVAGPGVARFHPCLLYTSPSPRDVEESRMPSSA